DRDPAVAGGLRPARRVEPGDQQQDREVEEHPGELDPNRARLIDHERGEGGQEQYEGRTDYSMCSMNRSSRLCRLATGEVWSADSVPSGARRQRRPAESVKLAAGLPIACHSSQTSPTA